MKEILVAMVVVLLTVYGSSAQADALIIGLIEGTDAKPVALGTFTLIATSDDVVINTVNFTASEDDTLSISRLTLQPGLDPAYHSGNTGMVIQSDSSETLSVRALVSPNYEEHVAIIIPEPATFSILAIGAITCLGRSRRKKAG